MCFLYTGLFYCENSVYALSRNNLHHLYYGLIEVREINCFGSVPRIGRYAAADAEVLSFSMHML